jgi:hypothetical protein
MIWSWALSTFAPETLEQQLQFNTQYFQYVPATWLQEWLLHSWQTINESSSPASVFANDKPPDSPIPPPPAAPPPMFKCTRQISVDLTALCTSSDAGNTERQ